MSYRPTKERLLEHGEIRARRFCDANKLVMPELRVVPQDQWRFDSTCAYYRPTYIAICAERCAWPGHSGRAWSWPGYVVDRTPYGVVQHELGHHVDIVVSGMSHGYQGTFSTRLRKDTREEPITGYAPNDAEWFAEIFRLFVTNPHLLQLIRPRTYGWLRSRFVPVGAHNWEVVLEDAPERTKAQTAKKIAEAYVKSNPGLFR